MKRNRKAKILATLGPASSSSDLIESLFKAGCDVFRLNFSHGSVETHRQNLESIRTLEEKYDHASCILADLQGPKLRVGEFKNTEESLKKGQKFILDTNSALGDAKRVNFPHSEIYDHLTPNSTLLINDGRIRLQVIEQYKDQLITEVLNDGVISNNKGVNIPDVILPIDSMTTKDKADLQKALEMNVDWVALSFVQQAEDIIKLKKIVDGKAMIMAKIEKPSAVKNIDEIIKVADCIMITPSNHNAISNFYNFINIFYSRWFFYFSHYHRLTINNFLKLNYIFSLLNERKSNPINIHFKSFL